MPWLSIRTIVAFVIAILLTLSLETHATQKSLGIAEPTLIKAIDAGSKGAAIRKMVRVGNAVYFLSTSESGDNSSIKQGSEGLWKTDGTPDGTTLVKPLSGDSSNLMAVKNTVFFVVAEMKRQGGLQLWKSDGTKQGTQLVKSITKETFPSSDSVTFLTVNDGALYFIVQDDQRNQELWKTDGTPTGTSAIKKLNQTSESSSKQIETVTFNQKVYLLVASEETSEVWQTDGTTQGTVLIKEIIPGNPNFRIAKLATVGQDLYVIGSTGLKGQRKLVVYQVSETKTTLAGTINLTGSPKFITSQTALNQALFFVLSSQTEDSELWKCDQKGITLVKKFELNNDSVPNFLTALGNAIYFQASDPIRGAELWRSDGTEKGTVLLKDINSKGNGAPTLLEVIGDRIYFTADDGIHGFEVWKTDGTQAGTTLVKDINPGIDPSFPYQFIAVNNSFVFTAFTNKDGFQLWKSNGLEADTSQVKKISTEPRSAPTSFVQMGNNSYFVATTYDKGTELWKTDGKTAAIVKDIASGLKSSDPQSLTAVGNSLYFVVTAPESATIGDVPILGLETQLWKTDGTETGTVPVFDANSLKKQNSQLGGISNQLFGVGNTLYFLGGTTSNQTGLFKLNGDILQLVKAFSSDSLATEFTVFKNQLFFVNGENLSGQDKESAGLELWKTDGTTAGTGMVKDINPKGSSAPYELTVAGDTLYFSADDGEHGYELWKTDGTNAGTQIVIDLMPGAAGSNLTQLLPVGKRLYWVGYTPLDRRINTKTDCPNNSCQPGSSVETNSKEASLKLWRTEGTANTTEVAIFIKPGKAASGSGQDFWNYLDTVVVGRTVYTPGPYLTETVTVCDGTKKPAQKAYNASKIYAVYDDVEQRNKRSEWISSVPGCTKNDQEYAPQLQEIPQVKLAAFNDKLYVTGYKSDSHQVWTFDREGGLQPVANFSKLQPMTLQPIADSMGAVVLDVTTNQWQLWKLNN